MEDSYNIGTQFPHIVTPIEKDKELFDLLFKYKPFDDPSVDVYFYLQSQPFRVVFSKSWIERIGKLHCSNIT